jgi:hypothetical protein
MMRKHHPSLLLPPVGLLLVGVVGIMAACRGAGPDVSPCEDVNRLPEIRPAFHDCVIPPNIAPLNLRIAEPGRRYFVKIYAAEGRAIEILSRSPVIHIPPAKWCHLLELNRGKTLAIDVFVESNPSGGKAARWQQFRTLKNRIAAEDIDRFLVYRKIHPAHSAWRDIGIYQRDLSSFDESTVLSNGSFRQGCLNCHTFRANRTDTMLISFRGQECGVSAVIVDHGRAEKVNAKFGYTAWHPSGKLVTFANTAVALFLHAAAEEVRDVIDLDAFLAYYRLDRKTIETAPPLARKDRLETYPTWSPDGRHLYFCSAPLTWEKKNVIPENYRDVKYDLVRVAYDLENDRWGELETVLSAQKTGQSILLPRISPDGRWLLFCMCDYGCFPVYRKSSDLYLMDLNAAPVDGARPYRRLDINSEHSESWHSWSSNSRWIAFSSKRDNGVFTRIYLSHVAPNGTVSKPLLLPQKEPTFYDSCLNAYNVPELVIEPVPLTKERLARTVRSKEAISPQMPITMATPEAQPEEPYVQTRE